MTAARGGDGGAVPRPVVAVGHRGDPYRVRENTLPSVRSALERGADAVEVDVRVTRDGVPVLLHDSSLKRLWGHDLAVADITHADLSDLTRGGVPTLLAALRAPGPVSDARLMIDLPDSRKETVDTVVGTVRECGAGERVYYCAGADAMLAVRAADPAAEIAMTWQSLAPPRPVLLEAVRPRWLNYRFGLVSRELTERVHRDGYLVSAWTVDTGRSMRRLVGAGVDSITTNRIDKLASELRTDRLRGPGA
ncbi:glycerophosphoryl diester phosphodiesterase [Streptomyces camponoticapitis]|uniref:Glycerophosphoryl diester phosphodiesterase n=1 Tax=Streptomyces camponoticapitis TaxID=1616125 RepID=A0ABQ2DVE5_9ACTN|nr:glycerophosphoryl diester phosphodiesterase [Streptomyces camponoticapitis]